MRGKYLLGLALLASCGRWGFSEPDGGIGQALDGDGLPGDLDGDATGDDSAIDAMIDATNMATYTVATSSGQTYTALPGAQTVPGFLTTADDESYAMTLPFTFKLYGVPYTVININANGFVTFSGTPTGVDTYLNDCLLDTTTPDATIAVFWDDLFSNTSAAPVASMTYAQDLAGADRWFAIEWRDFDAYFLAGGGNNHFSQGLRVTQQLVLHESGVIEMKYGPRSAPTLDRDCGLARQQGCSATIGVEAAGNAPTKTIQCGTALGTVGAFTAIDAGRVFTLTPQ